MAPLTTGGAASVLTFRARGRKVLVNSRTTSDVWIARSERRPTARLRLFCFPYAGGSSALFREWPARLPEAIDPVLVELPGRGARLNESCFEELPPLVQATYEGLNPHFDRPFAFFGHSMGALLAFELARLLRRQGGPTPVHLFVSGSAAPRVPRADLSRHGLPRIEFIQELRRMNGTPAEVLDNPELMDILLPLLRADFAVSENYTFESDSPLKIPITAFGGVEDTHITREEFHVWNQETSGPFVLHMIQGDHFFLNTAHSTIIESIEQELFNGSFVVGGRMSP